jgi:hypothetical protein
VVARSLRFLVILILPIAVSYADAADQPRTQKPVGASTVLVTLADAYHAAGFDPTATGCSVFVVQGDIHYPAGGETMPGMIAQWNAMVPAPRFVVFVGDLICSGSVCFGAKPDKRLNGKAREEFALFKRDLQRLNPAIAVKLVPGNHDTYPYEPDMGLFREAFPDREPYGSFDLDGIHFLLWNGQHWGCLDDKQMEFMRQDLRRVPHDRTIITFVHQPSLGSVVNERGIPKAVRELFAASTGQLWLVAGHVHQNGVSVFQLPKTTIVQASVVNGNRVKGGGYWVYCLKDGAVAVRIFRQLDGHFVVDRPPDRAQARPLPQPFAGRNDLLWTLLLGESTEDKPCFVSGKGGDCKYYWFYLRELVYKLPLRKAGHKATSFAVLGRLDTPKGIEPVSVAVSTDNRTWTNLTLPGPRSSVYTFEIPVTMRQADDLFVQVTGPGYKGNVAVGGFALCR